MNAFSPETAHITSQNLIPRILNTRERLEAFLRYEEALEGAVTAAPPHKNSIDEACGIAPVTEASTLGMVSQSIDDAMLLLQSDYLLDAKECRRPHIFFGNGVQNGIHAANISRTRLEHVTRQLYPAAAQRHMRFHNAFNPPLLEPDIAGDKSLARNAFAALLDALEAAGQEIDSNPDLIPHLAGIVATPRGESRGLSDSIEQLLIQALLEFARDASFSLAGTETTVDEHVSAYRSAIANGGRVLVVAHSQGNYFANAAYKALSEEKREHMEIIGIATPTSFVGLLGQNYPYITLETDLVIKSMREVMLSAGIPNPPLVPNAGAGSTDSADPLHHGFLEAYSLRGTSTRIALEGMLKEYIGEVYGCDFRPIDARGTYLHVDDRDRANSPTSVVLSEIGVEPGDEIQLRGTGIYRYGHGSDATATGSIAVFSGPAGFISPADGSTTFGIVTLPTCPAHGLPTDVQTDIPQDFSVINGHFVTAVVPEGATELKFSVNDCYFADNSNPDPDFGVILRY